MCHPREMGVADLDAFLFMLANERKVSASTHNQALSAVLTQDEVAGLLAQTEGMTALLAGGTASPLDLLLQV